MPRSIEYVRRFFTWVARGVGAILTSIVITGRRGFRRRKLLEKTKVAPSTSTNSLDMKNLQLTHIEDLSEFSRLPSHTRRHIYIYLSPNDILNLRLINKRFQEDVSSLRGLHVRLYIFFRNYDFLRSTGVESLTIDFLNSLHPIQRKRILKFPDLLKELKVSGMIDPEDLQYFFRICPNLERLEINFNVSDTQSQPIQFTTIGELEIPQNLKTLRITSSGRDPIESAKVLLNVQTILSRTKCPKIRSFTFQLVDLEDSFGVDHYHLAVLNFIQCHTSSLKEIEIKIQHSILHSSMQLRHLHRDKDEETNDWTKKLHLTKFQISIDCYLEEWKRLLGNQNSLRSVDLEVEGSNWIDVISIVVTNCGNTLRVVTISNISLMRTDDESHALDMRLLRHCINLEELHLHHQVHSEFFSPRLSHASTLPKTLKELCLQYFIVKPHQELTILLLLPRLETLKLGYWKDSDASIAAFFRTLNFLIRMNMTNVGSFVFRGSKLQFEKRRAEIMELIDHNKNAARFLHVDTDGYEASLSIERY